MSIIGTAVGAAGSIFGGLAASKAMKKVKNNLNQQRQDNLDWYNRRYNEDATQRADAQAMLTKVQEDIRTRNRQAAGMQAVMGGTDESVAAAKAANNEALAATTSNIVVNGEARKDAIESAYQQRDAALQGELNDLEMKKAQEIKGAIQGVQAAASKF